MFERKHIELCKMWQNEVLDKPSHTHSTYIHQNLTWVAMKYLCSFWSPTSDLRHSAAGTGLSLWGHERVWNLWAIILAACVCDPSKDNSARTHLSNRRLHYTQLDVVTVNIKQSVVCRFGYNSFKRSTSSGFHMLFAVSEFLSNYSICCVERLRCFRCNINANHDTHNANLQFRKPTFLISVLTVLVTGILLASFKAWRRKLCQIRGCTQMVSHWYSDAHTSATQMKTVYCK